MIELAIRDCAQIKCLEGKPNLTAHERKKLGELTGEWHPADFLDGDWFEETCAMLNVQPETIRKRLPPTPRDS